MSFGASDLKSVRDETDQLIRDLSASLVNLWDVVSTLSGMKPDELQPESFEKLYQYFYRFYLGPENLSAARTHCGNVERAVGKIKFKLSQFLHTDLGKWAEADSKLSAIVTADPVILGEYDQVIESIHQQLKEVRKAFASGDHQKARGLYAELLTGLEPDIEGMRKGVARMKESLEHVRKISG
jgi:hypothetical protein